MGVGDMGNVPRGYRVAINDLEASGVLEGCEWELVMVGKIFVDKSDSRSSAVNEGMDGNSPVAEGDIA